MVRLFNWIIFQLSSSFVEIISNGVFSESVIFTVTSLSSNITFLIRIVGSIFIRSSLISSLSFHVSGLIGNNGLLLLIHCGLLSGFSVILLLNKIVAFLSFSLIISSVILLTNSVGIDFGISSLAVSITSFNSSGFNHFLSSNSLLIYFITCLFNICSY